MKTKQPKAFRGHYDIRTMDVLCAINRNHELYPDNCTVIPDGAAIPLPADVRRVLKASLAMADIGGQMANILFNCHQTPDLFRERLAMIDSIRRQWDAIPNKHQRAEKRRRGK